jgi:hypothetical protein
MGDRKSKQNCLHILAPNTDSSPQPDSQKQAPQCNVTFTFEQFTTFITSLTKEFSTTVKELVNKFEAMNESRINTLEGHIFELNNKVDKLESNIDKISKINQTLRSKLCDNFINGVKEKEREKSNDFTISGFTEQVALDEENTLKSPQELMDSFTRGTLKINEQIQITNGSIHTSVSKSNGDAAKFFKLSGTLKHNNEWKSIFSNISALKDTNLFLDRSHCQEVQYILNDFKRKVGLERQQNNKNAFVKNLTLHINDNTFEVFDILKSNYFRDISKL